MKKNKKKRKKGLEETTHPKDKRTERMVFACIIFLMIIGVAMGYLISREFS